MAAMLIMKKENNMTMKKFLFMCLAGALLLTTSCKSVTDDPTEPGESEYAEFALNVQKDGYKAGKNGVNINVTSLQADNIVFEIVPGESVKSYRMEVYPKALLYNELLNRGLVDAEPAACEDAVADLLASSTAGASVNLFNQETEDFAAKEFDWANSVYNQAAVLSDCDYMITVLPFYDEEGQVPAPVCICELATKKGILKGKPEIEIESIVGHTAFIVKYHPNDDCRYFYHWIWSTDEIGEFIDLFGEKMMRDFCRVAGGPYDAANQENLAFKRTTTMPDNTAVVVAADENMNPAGLVRLDFSLLEKPQTGDFTPEVAIEAGSRIGATMTNISVSMEKSCENCYYRVYARAEADAIQGASADEKITLAANLRNEGWGVSNPNFRYDTDLQQLTGASFTTEGEVKFNLEPESEYVIIYVGENRFDELSEIKFSAPFTTKPLVRDNPEACVGDVQLAFTDVSRWGVRYNFSYDFSKNMCYRFQIVWPFTPDDPTTDEDDAFIRPPHLSDGQLDFDNREAWLYYLIDAYVEGPAGKRPVANLWQAEPSGYDSLADFGYESGTEYIIAYCAEDVNGVIGPVHFESFTTTKPNPGPNPEVSFEGLTYDPSSRSLVGKVVANADTKMICYFTISSNSGDIYNLCGLPYLTVPNGRYTYQAYLDMWKLNLVESGLTTSAEEATIVEQVDPTSENPVLIAAVAIGEKDMEDVYSPVIAKIFHKGELKDLSDFRTPPTE